MKILFFIESLGSGGAQRQMVALAKLFKRLGHNVSILVYHREDFFNHFLETESISIHYIIEKRLVFRIFKIRKFIRKSGFDVVVSFLETPNFLNCIAAIGGKTWKVVTSERSSKNSTFLTVRGVIFGWFQRYSDALVCNSYVALAKWKYHYPRYQNKLYVIYNPIIIPEITSDYRFKRNGRLQLVVAASYQYLKNPIGLIEAIALLSSEDRKKIEVNWYGRTEVVRGDCRAYNEALGLIEKYDLMDVIHLNDETVDIANRMYESDIVALFSELEGLPNSICEGMMLGKPLVMTKVSDYSKLIDESNGFLCDWNDIHSIKNVLKELSDISTEKLIKLGINSKIKAFRLFDENTIVEKWLTILDYSRK